MRATGTYYEHSQSVTHRYKNTLSKYFWYYGPIFYSIMVHPQIEIGNISKNHNKILVWAKEGVIATSAKPNSYELHLIFP